jgi:hypothetical protein
MQGFNIVAGGQLAARPEFQKQFGRLQPDGSYIIPARYLPAWNSIAPACEIVSTFIYAPLLERFGRKLGILVTLFISVAGVLLARSYSSSRHQIHCLVAGMMDPWDGAAMRRSSP